MTQVSLLHIPQLLWELRLVPLELEKGREFNFFSGEIKKKEAVWPQSNELKVNTLSGRAVAGTDKGEGSRDSVEMGRHFPHIGTFLDVCTFCT